MKKFHHVGLAGTFDRLHAGHKSLIDLAFTVGHRVSLGIARKICSQDKFLAEKIEDYIIRRKEVEDCLRSKNFLTRASIFPLDDIYGTAKTDKTLEAIIVSKKTYPNALKINQLRKQKNLPLLKIIVAAYVLGNDGKIISSGRIRGGEIDREGNNYQLSLISNEKEKLILPEYLREELRKPLGQVILGNENQLKETAKKTLQLINILKSTLVISVGDVITSFLLKIGFDPEIKIIDFRVRRKALHDSHRLLADLHGYPWQSVINQRKSSIINRPGTISTKVVNGFKRTLKTYFKTKQKQLIIVDGEEDLTALPAILLAPLGSLVLYGQMDLGVVAVSVTEEKKRKVKEILRKFV